MPRKSDFLQVRISTRDKAALKRAAKAAGMDVSAYVLARALPERRARWDALMAGLADDPKPSFRLSAVHDLLADAAPVDFGEVVGGPPPAATPDWVANTVAAMVEHTAVRLRRSPPAWVLDIAPLATPWFATSLMSLRAHLLVASPVAFRRRNLFVNATVGARR